MPKKHPFEVRVTDAARRDIRDILEWSRNEFGESAALRYDALLRQALIDLRDNPERLGSSEREKIQTGIRVYHLRFSRKKIRSGNGVHNPRHFLIYRFDDAVVEILRVLHDSRDLPRHLL